MLFLQFISDKDNNHRVITNCGLNLMCKYANDFLEQHVSKLAQSFAIDSFQGLME